MHHFFADPSLIEEKSIQMKGQDVNHMRHVLRMKCGEKLTISNGQGTHYVCEIDKYEDNRAILKILSEMGREAELSSRIFLFQGLPKGDKMELIIQKAVELGVYEIIPVATNRSVVKLDQKKSAKKAERWNAIALSAAKQCRRSLIPNVRQVISFEQALQLGANLDVLLLPYECAVDMEKTKAVISTLKADQDIGVFIGPEGGFEETEVQRAVQAGAFEITLGKRILRTETAGLVLISLLMYHLEQ